MQLGSDLPIAHAIDAVGFTKVRLSRAALIRRIELGIIAGGRDPYIGWYCNVESLERYASLSIEERRELAPVGRPRHTQRNQFIKV